MVSLEEMESLRGGRERGNTSEELVERWWFEVGSEREMGVVALGRSFWVLARMTDGCRLGEKKGVQGFLEGGVWMSGTDR